MVVCTHGGDVWIVSGIDAGLAKLQWRRFAAGLYEPFGLQVVDNKNPSCYIITPQNFS